MFINRNNYSKDEFYMRLALMQAYKNLGQTKDNPSVGCVIVKNNSVIGAGQTSINGRPHAEFNAITFAKDEVKNTDLYVTLEPCSNYGKTPPCVNLISKKRIKKVFFSVLDPDPLSYKKSIAFFKKKKIKIKKNILYSEIKNFYKSYFKYKKNNLPFVTAKIAISNDFFTKDRRNKWITNFYARSRGHYIRSSCDSILSTSKTILDDNSKLTCRIPGLENRSPSRIILDKNLMIPLKSSVFKTSKKHNTIIFFNKFNKSKIKYLKKNKVKLFYAPLEQDGNFDLKKILIKIKKFGFSRLLVESGTSLIKNLLSNNLIDDFYLFQSKTFLKKNGKKSFKSIFNIYLKRKKKNYIKVNLFGDKLIYFNIKNV